MEILEFQQLSYNNLIKKYIKRVEINKKSKKATESSYYSDFKTFLESIFPPNKGYLVQVESKDINPSIKPDITVSHEGIVLFHVEAKIPESNIEDMINENESRLNDQIYRYRQDGTQVLLTDFYNIYLIDSSKKNEAKKKQHYSFKCNLIKSDKDKLKISPNAEKNLKTLLIKTCDDYIQTVSNVKKLIPILSVIAQDIKGKTHYLLIHQNSESLSNTEKTAAQYLLSILSDFKKSIFKEEVEDENKLFSDLFAQTIVYGAFSAWIKYCQQGNKPQKFSLDLVGDYLPFGSFLRDLFLNLRNRTPKEFKPLLDKMQSKFEKVDYRILNNTESLITTFYSDFLQEYDPETAKNRGVVYTPHTIVKFIINGIDFLLQRWFDKADGIISEYSPKDSNKALKDIKKTRNTKKKTKQVILEQSNPLNKNSTKTMDRIKILDPAAGTMAFSSGFLQVAKEKFDAKFPQNSVLSSSNFEDWVKREFFPNSYAFEILMAPYVLGQIRTFLTLESLGLKLNPSDYKLNTFLMNTLMTPPEQENLDKWYFNNQDIGREIKEALYIRDKKDIFIVMGNPPYNLSSQNNCKWINEKIDDYKKDLDEKNLKILSDDYVKFIRFGQWKIEKVGRGILALITNSKFIDGQIYSVMRKSLRISFDHIYIVNLHGDMRKKEKGNVFDIRVGTCVFFMIRINNSPNKNAAIHYMDVPHPTKEEKFSILQQGFKEEKFKLLSETRKNFFVDIDTTHLERFEQFVPINKFFKKRPTSGIMAGKDHLLMDVDKDCLKWNIETFFKKDFTSLENMKIKINDTKSWTKQKVLDATNCSDVLSSITMIQYRGFDFRYFAYQRDIVEGHRMGYIDHISKNNFAITVTKSSRKKHFSTAFISQNPVEKCFMSVTDTAYSFLQKYNGKSNIILPDIPFSINDEQLFYYIYGVLYAPTYRDRYDEYLRKEYPRIPLTKNKDLFNKMYKLGKELAKNHLLNIEISPKLELSDIALKNWKVGKYWYCKEEKCLYFDKKNDDHKNPIPWIRGITPDMWEFEIGSKKQLELFLSAREYSSARKWDTLNRPLNNFELMFFLKICTSIEKTLELLPRIDEIFKKIDYIEED